MVVVHAVVPPMCKLERLPCPKSLFPARRAETSNYGAGPLLFYAPPHHHQWNHDGLPSSGSFQYVCPSLTSIFSCVDYPSPCLTLILINLALDCFQVDINTILEEKVHCGSRSRSYFAFILQCSLTIRNCTSVLYKLT
jgi:hypothetical protein